MSQTTNELRALVLNHRRHVELSPGVGEDAQSYALAVLDDLLNDLAAPAPGAGEDVPEGCTPADAEVLRTANHALADENARLRHALQFYADGDHFNRADPEAWDTVSGEPPNLWCDEAGTATVEDGHVARAALGGRHEQAQGGMAWVDRPTEPGWYWHATDEGMEPVEVMVRPGHSYLATLEIGSFGKREFHPVMRQRGQWLRIGTPTRPTADARQETQG